MDNTCETTEATLLPHPENAKEFVILYTMQLCNANPERFQMILISLAHQTGRLIGNRTEKMGTSPRPSLGL